MQCFTTPSTFPLRSQLAVDTSPASSTRHLSLRLQCPDHFPLAGPTLPLLLQVLLSSHLYRRRPRSRAFIFPHSPFSKASFAAATALSTSLTWARDTWQMTCGQNGDMTASSGSRLILGYPEAGSHPSHICMEPSGDDSAAASEEPWQSGAVHTGSRDPLTQ